MLSSQSDLKILKIFMILIRAIVLVSIALEALAVLYLIVHSFYLSFSWVSSATYDAIDGALFLLALVEIYMSLGYLPSNGRRSLAMVLEAGLSYTVREIIIEFHTGQMGLDTMGALALVILSLGISLYVTSLSNPGERKTD
ncbi:MAG: phosphate-starvation-inducible PsiE family protein [Thermoplasmataceae archaeon]